MTRYAWIDINSVAVESYIIKYTINRKLSTDRLIDELNIEFSSSILDVLTPTLGQQIEVYGGYDSTKGNNPRIFYGKLKVVQETKEKVTMIAYTRLAELMEKNVNADFRQSGSTSGIITNIMEELIQTFGGLTPEVTASTLTIERFKCRNADILERLQTLAEVLDYDIIYDNDNDKVICRPQEFNISSSIYYVQGTNNIAQEVPKWKSSTLGEIYNKLTLNGAKTLVTKTQTFSGDGSTSTFSLAHPPESIRVTVGGVEKVGGKDGSTPGTFDYTIDTEEQQLIFESGSIPGSGSDNISATIVYNVPVPVVVEDEASIATYGEIHKQITLTDISTVDDAILKARKLLQNHSAPYKNTLIKIKPLSIPTANPVLGQKIKVIDTINNINAFYVIKETTEYFPEKQRDIIVADREWRWQNLDDNAQIRLKRLEEQNQEGDEIVTNVLQFKIPATLKRKALITEVERINDSFILGHRTNGQLGRGAELDDFETTPTSNWAGTNCSLAEES